MLYFVSATFGGFPTLHLTVGTLSESSELNASSGTLTFFNVIAFRDLLLLSQSDLRGRPRVGISDGVKVEGPAPTYC